MRPVQLTPDGQRYVAAAEGRRVAKPFHYRWLLPALFGPYPKWWVRCADGCSILLPLIGFWFAGGGWKGAFVAGMCLGLSGVIRFNRRFPVLVDLPAMTVALASAAAWKSHWYAIAIFLALVAACIKETSPVFAAAWAWNPWLLLGLIAPAVRFFMRRGEEPVLDTQEWSVRDVVIGAFSYRNQHGVQRFAYVLPWGACLVGLAHFSPQLAVVLALAYGQLIIATDVVRLYQWAWPTLAVAAACAVPPVWYPVLIALHLCNPFAGEGA